MCSRTLIQCLMCKVNPWRFWSRRVVERAPAQHLLPPIDWSPQRCGFDGFWRQARCPISRNHGRWGNPQTRRCKCWGTAGTSRPSNVYKPKKGRRGPCASTLDGFTRITIATEDFPNASRDLFMSVNYDEIEVFHSRTTLSLVGRSGPEAT